MLHSIWKCLKYKYLALVVVSFISVLLVGLSLKIAFAYYQTPQPEAILTLGGGEERETFTAQFAQSYPYLPIWVSTGISRTKALQIFQKSEVSPQLINLDYRATDTVTNFTSLVKDFQRQGYQHIYLITSDFHMPRAKAIAFFVLGSHGIAYAPIAIPSDKAAESKLKVIRDAARSVVWLITGKTVSSLNTKYARRILKKGGIYVN